MRGAIARRLFLAASAVLALGLFTGRALAAGPQIVGWVEVVQLHADRTITLKAKMDSGAKTSSLAVTDLQRFSRGGRPWVRFRIQASNGAKVTIERPVLRTVRIKRHGRASKARPVVVMGLCVGSVFKRTQIDLADRGNYLYPLLVGRRFLQGDFLIDPGRTLTVAPHCAAAQ